MTIKEIYTNYRIMPNLQLHQMRVAAVARLLAEAANLSTDLEAITTATLLHDMGNIIKFNLSLYPAFLEPEGLEYWQQVQQQFFEKYGRDEHLASELIAQEIGISPRAMELMKCIGFTQMAAMTKQEDLAMKIVCYADTRVSPTGITSLFERTTQGQARYRANKGIKAAQDRYEQEITAGQLLEQQIFKVVAPLEPDDINDRTIAPLISELPNFVISTN